MQKKSFYHLHYLFNFFNEVLEVKKALKLLGLFVLASQLVIAQTTLERNSNLAKRQTTFRQDIDDLTFRYKTYCRRLFNIIDRRFTLIRLVYTIDRATIKRINDWLRIYPTDSVRLRNSIRISELEASLREARISLLKKKLEIIQHDSILQRIR